MISPSRKARLKDADVRDVADRLGLQGRGARRWCPLCQGDGEGHRDPDLSVRPEGWRCFKCGEHGDAVDLVQAVEGLPFVPAVERLEQLLGITAADDSRRRAPRSAPKPVPRPKPPEIPAGLFESFCGACRPVLEVPAAIAWLESKAISAGTAEVAGVKFIGGDLPDVLDMLRDRFGEEAVGASRLKGVWPFYKQHVGAVAFPYREKGQLVGIKVRPHISKTEAEAVAVPRFIQCGSLSVPFLSDYLDWHPGADVIVCEGESDTLAAISAGALAIGIPGAKSFRPDWCAMLRGRRVFLGFDPDEAGQEATLSVADLLEQDEQTRPKLLPLPAGMDLSDYLFSRSGERAEDFEERAAIMEFDGGLPRAEAERAARVLVYGPERNVSPSVETDCAEVST